MNEHNQRGEQKSQASIGSPTPERDVFLELWAAEMLIRRRLVELARTLAFDARRAARSEIGTANIRATLMLAAVFAVTGTLIALLEQVMPAWRAALVTSIVMTTLGFSLLQERWVSGAVCVVRNVRREVGRRELVRIRVSSR